MSKKYSNYPVILCDIVFPVKGCEMTWDQLRKNGRDRLFCSFSQFIKIQIDINGNKWTFVYE